MRHPLRKRSEPYLGKFTADRDPTSQIAGGNYPDRYWDIHRVHCPGGPVQIDAVAKVLHSHGKKFDKSFGKWPGFIHVTPDRMAIINDHGDVTYLSREEMTNFMFEKVPHLRTVGARVEEPIRTAMTFRQTPKATEMNPGYQARKQKTTAHP
jgi:hypothetical protein